MYLSAGDMIPADIRIIQAKDLFISQSALTGESEAVEKVSEASNNDGAVLERKTLHSWELMSLVDMQRRYSCMYW